MGRMNGVPCVAGVLLAGVILTPSCGRREKPRPADSSTRPFWAELTPPAPFRVADDLVCRTLLSTHQPFVNTTFELVGVKSTNPVAVGESKREPMSVLQQAGDRLVLQVAGQDPGSVVTLSLDEASGAFALQWSGWDPNGKLSVGAQRGFCEARRPGAQGR